MERLTPMEAKVYELVERQGVPIREAARQLDRAYSGVWQQHKNAVAKMDGEQPETVSPDVSKLENLGYDLTRDQMTPAEAWASHADVVERKIAKTLDASWRAIQRPRGAFVLFHCTDTHVDDDATPLRLIESDIKAAQGMDAIMCHGGDLLNNWPLGGKLAKKWAEQECTMPAALLRAQHYIDMFQPEVWIDGNHEEMNPYLMSLIDQWLPEGIIRDYWSVKFLVKTPGGRDIRVGMSHKYQKGSSWFHKMHGHIREMLEGEPLDILMDGHLHSEGVLDHSLPERRHASLAVASAGYKGIDEWATRISKGGNIPVKRGRAHWIVVDPMADYDANTAVAFKCPRQADAYFNGLQNLRCV